MATENQKYIRTEYSDGGVVLSNLRNKKGIPVIGLDAGYTATKVTTWYDGTPMDDSKADGKVYLKLKDTGEYFKANLPNDKELFLEKDTMAQFRGLSSVEMLLLKMGYYKGVRLNGYYTKGDTPAPIEYYISDVSQTDNGGNVIEVGGVKLEHIFTESIYTEYFGLRTSSSPTEVFTCIQNCFDAGELYKVRNVYIQEGDYIISTINQSLIYRISDSSLYFKGSLKLADNTARLIGTLLIRYSANNINVYDQKLDGNRANNPISDSKGVQFNFATYGFNNINFIRGWSRNAPLCHMQSTSENVTFSNMEFDTSGEHCLYLTLSSNQPLQRVIVSNCIFRNYGIHLSATAITVRDYRYALIDNCEFYPTDSIKPEGAGNISSTLDYDSTIQEGESLKHIIRNCKIYNQGVLSYSINGCDDTNKNGTYIEGGYIEGNIINGVSVVGSTLKNVTSSSVFRRIPKRIERCYIEDWRTLVPDDGFTFDLINNYFKKINYPENTNSLVNIAQSPLLSGNINILGNTFEGYDLVGSAGLIRGKEGVKLTVMNNKLKDCGTVLFTRLTSQDMLVNNSDVSASGIRSNFSVQPKIVSNNDYIRSYGTSAERPSGTGFIPLNHIYFNTTLGTTERYDGTTWAPISASATPTVKGVVNQSANVTNSTATLPTSDAASVATDVAGAVTDLNDLITKYNSLLMVVTELQTKLNAKLTNDRTSGQQATT